MGKYEPLPQFLSSRQGSHVRVSISEIEAILGFSLPRSAYQYEAWWSNNHTGHSHARSWLEAGWKTEALDLARRQVTFVRTSAIAANGRRRKRANPYGCMKGTVLIYPGTDLTAPSDEEWNAEKGLLLNE